MRVLKMLQELALGEGQEQESPTLQGLSPYPEHVLVLSVSFHRYHPALSQAALSSSSPPRALLPI